MEGEEDLHLAILLYITTPLNHSLPSPAELLNSRKLKKIQMLTPTSITATKTHTKTGE